MTHFNISRGQKGRLKRNFRKLIGKEVFLRELTRMIA